MFTLHNHNLSEKHFQWTTQLYCGCGNLHFFLPQKVFIIQEKNGPPGNDENFVASFHTFLVLLKIVKTTSWLCPKAILKEYLLQVINTKIVYLVQSISNLNLIHALLIIWIDSYGLLYIMFYKVIWIKCRVKY